MNWEVKGSQDPSTHQISISIQSPHPIPGSFLTKMFFSAVQIHCLISSLGSPHPVPNAFYCQDMVLFFNYMNSMMSNIKEYKNVKLFPRPSALFFRSSNSLSQKSLKTRCILKFWEAIFSNTDHVIQEVMLLQWQSPSTIPIELFQRHKMVRFTKLNYSSDLITKSFFKAYSQKQGKDMGKNNLIHLW